MSRERNTHPAQPVSKGFQYASALQPAQTMPNSPAPFSLRLTREERSRLEAEAGQQPLGAYIRSRLLGDQQRKRRARRATVKDYEKLALVLAELGRSHLASNMNQLAKAANSGTLGVTLDVTRELLQACEQIREIRETLIAALGVEPESGE